MTKKISVIIPAYNEQEYLAACLDALAHQTFPRKDFEIIVVDNNSTDTTSEIARTHGADHVILETRKGTNQARQTGFEHASGRVIAFLDADCVPPDFWLERIYIQLHQKPSGIQGKFGKLVGVAGPYDFQVDRGSPLYALEKLYSWAVLPTMASVMGRVFKRGGAFMGGNFATFKKHLDKINGLDTSKVFFGDDAKIARDLGKLGYVKFDPKLYVYSSPRRFEREGLVMTNLRYTKHYFKVMMER